MPIALVAHVTAAPGANGGATGTLTSTGATLLLCGISAYSATASATPTDSKTNSWTDGTGQSNYPTTQTLAQLHYAANPSSVGTLHLCTYAKVASYPVVQFSAWSGVKATSPLDKESGALGTNVSSILPGTVIPTTDGQLVVIVLCHASSSLSGLTPPTGFTQLDATLAGAGNNEGSAVFYKILGASTAGLAVTPAAISWTGATDCAVTMSTFKSTVVGTPPVISYATPQTVYINTAMTPISPTNTGGAATAYSISAGALPTGVTIHATTGVISGTPTTAGTYSYTVLATNADGGGAFTGSIVSNVTATAPTVWLKGDVDLYTDASATVAAADGGSIYVWKDQSGNAYNATQATANSRPRMNSTDGTVECECQNAVTAVQFMSIVSPPSINHRNFSLFFIGYLNTQRASYSGAADQAFHVIAESIGGTVISFNYASDVAAGNPVIAKPQVSITGSWRTAGGYVPQGACLLGIVGSATELKFIVNGVIVSTTPLAVATTTDTWAILGRDASNFALMGGARDILFYNSAITDAECAALFTYAQQRGAAAAPTTTLVIDGDSISQGFSATRNRNWVREVLDVAPASGYRSYCTAQQGLTLSTMTSEAAARVDVLKGSGANVLVVFAGTNDIAAGASGATTYSRLVAHCQARVAAGWLRANIIVCNMLPRGDASFETERVAFNTAVANNALANWGAVVDLAAVSGLGGAGDNTGSNYNADQVHPNNAGHILISTAVLATLNGMMPVISGSTSGIAGGGVMTDEGVAGDGVAGGGVTGDS